MTAKSRRKAHRLDKQVKNKPLRDEKGRLLPGNTANPKGRPRKGQALAEWIRAELDKKHGKTKKTKGQIVAEKLVGQAIEGDGRAMHEVLDRVLGKPPLTMTFGQTFDPNVLDPIPAGTEEEVKARVRAILGTPGKNGDGD